MHYLVIYSKDGTIHLWPGHSREECINKAAEMYNKPKVRALIKATTIITRNQPGEFMFGHPKSLDIMQKGYIK